MVVVDNDEICNKTRYIEIADHLMESATGTMQHITKYISKLSSVITFTCFKNISIRFFGSVVQRWLPSTSF